MQERVLNNDKLTVHWNTSTLEVLGETEVEGARVKNSVTGEESTIASSAFFVAIGHKPNTDMFKNYLKMDDHGYLITHPDSTHTDIGGVYVCGDAQDSKYRQAVTAAGTGCMAALDAERYLTEKGII